MQEETDSKNVVKKFIISIFQKKTQEINIYLFFFYYFTWDWKIKSWKRSKVW